MAHIYRQLTRFMLPLALTVVISEVGGQILNGGMARVPRAAETLAGYGLAWGLMRFLSSPLFTVRNLGLVLVDGRRSFFQVRRFAFVSSLVAAGIITNLAFGPLSRWVIEGLHGISDPLVGVVRYALVWLIPIPILRAMGRFYAGMLVRVRRTDIVSYATVVGISASILTVFALLPTPFIQTQPILLPIFVTYAGTLINLGVIFWGYRRYATRLLEEQGTDWTLAYIFQFFWPLALVAGLQSLSRPLINLFLSRGPDSVEALAVLAVCFTLAQIPYNWLNEIRSLPAAFEHESNSLFYIRRFTFTCGVLSLGIMATLFWTPLTGHILSTLIGLDIRLTDLSRLPLRILSLTPLAVIVRVYLSGVAMLEHRTSALAWSAPTRIFAVFVALIVCPSFGLKGASLGAASMLSGHIFEASAVWCGVSRSKHVVKPNGS